MLQGGPEALETQFSQCHPTNLPFACLPLLSAHQLSLGRASLPGPFASAVGDIEACLGKKYGCLI